MDATAIGFEKGRTPFLDLPPSIAIDARIPGIPAASIATGASIVSGPAYDGIDADMVDMESFAVLRAAQHFGVPMIGIRGISDGRAELTGLHDWTGYLHIIDEKLPTRSTALPPPRRRGASAASSGPGQREVTDTVLIVDFGSQVTQLIARRVREAGVYSEIVPFHDAERAFRELKPKAVILSGGPASVSETGMPRAPQALFDAGVPVLGICYGEQTMVDQLGGEVQPADYREFGRAYVDVVGASPLFDGVWSRAAAIRSG